VRSRSAFDEGLRLTTGCLSRVSESACRGKGRQVPNRSSRVAWKAAVVTGLHTCNPLTSRPAGMPRCAHMTARRRSGTSGPDTRLATYGTLAPGRPNHGQLTGLSGRWLVGHVRGSLVQAGWGTARTRRPSEGRPPGGIAVPIDRQDRASVLRCLQTRCSTWSRQKSRARSTADLLGVDG